MIHSMELRADAQQFKLSCQTCQESNLMMHLEEWVILSAH